MKRKTFLRTTLLGSLIPYGRKAAFKIRGKAEKPVVISTWANEPANAAAWEILSKGGRALDAVEAGARARG